MQSDVNVSLHFQKSTVQGTGCCLSTRLFLICSSFPGPGYRVIKLLVIEHDAARMT